MDSNYKYMVCTQCMTYNQKPFIEETLRGFTMQQIPFPVVTVVTDDASTDGEQELLRMWVAENLDLTAADACERDADYAHIISAPLKGNPLHTFVFLFLKENHYSQKKTKQPYLAEWMDCSKYYAFCEGDDYWTEPLKLQQQVDFLENDPTVSFTCHRFKVFDQELDTWETDGHEKKFKDFPDGFRFSASQNQGWLTKTLTMVCRADAVEGCRQMGRWFDYIMVYFLLKSGDGYIFNACWGVYRKHGGGVRSKNSKLENARRMYRATGLLYEFDPNPTTRRIYYNSYATLFAVTKGGILFQEKFELRKFLSIGVSYLKKLYRLLLNKRK